MATYAPKPAELVRRWHVIDADGLVLGRLATEVARLIRGKHQPFYAPNCDTGDHVIVINAAKVVMTANKADAKFAYHHSGYPGGMRQTSYATLLQDNPVEVVERAVRGMVPKTKLGRQQLLKLKVYAGAEHPHDAQQPETYDTSSIRRAG